MVPLSPVSARHFVFISQFILLFSACGQHATKRSPPSPPEVEERRDGEEDNAFEALASPGSSYESECKASADAKTSVKETITFKERSFKKVWMNFDGIDCYEPIAKTSYTYLFADLKQKYSPLDGWKKYVYKYDAILVTPNTEEMTTLFNSVAAYGYKSWETKQHKNIAGRRYSKTDDASPQKGTIRNATMKISESTLYLARYINNIPTADDPFTYELIEE